MASKHTKREHVNKMTNQQTSRATITIRGTHLIIAVARKNLKSQFCENVGLKCNYFLNEFSQIMSKNFSCIKLMDRRKFPHTLPPICTLTLIVYFKLFVVAKLFTYYTIYSQINGSLLFRV